MTDDTNTGNGDAVTCPECGYVGRSLVASQGESRWTTGRVPGHNDRRRRPGSFNCPGGGKPSTDAPAAPANERRKTSAEWAADLVAAGETVLTAAVEHGVTVEQVRAAVAAQQPDPGDDNDTLRARVLKLIEDSGLVLDRGEYVENWPADEQELFRRAGWRSFTERSHGIQSRRRAKLTAALLPLVLDHGNRRAAQALRDAAAFCRTREAAALTRRGEYNDGLAAAYDAVADELTERADEIHGRQQ